VGDRRKQALRVQGDGKLRLEFHGAKVSSDAGLLAFRELEEAFRLTEKGSTMLSDFRHGKNTQHSMLAMLRRGNHASAKFWRRVLMPVIERYWDRDIPKYFRGDAAFAIPATYRLLEREGFRYAMRIPANDVLMASISHLLTRPVQRPSQKPKVFYESFWYQAQSWDRPRRVVANVEWHWDQLLPRVGFIVTNLTNRSRKIVHFYNQCGTAEQWIRVGKSEVKWTRLSRRSFKDNQARLQLFALAYNLGSFLRRFALPRAAQYWSLTTLREKLTKIGAKVVRHAKYVTFQLAEVAVVRELFAAILERIQRFGVPPPLIQRGSGSGKHSWLGCRSSGWARYAPGQCKTGLP